MSLNAFQTLFFGCGNVKLSRFLPKAEHYLKILFHFVLITTGRQETDEGGH